jgi:hypothetical protein
VWAELDVDALKGRPAQLAWSDDDGALYLQVVDGTVADKLTYHHYLIRKNERAALLDRQPTWAQAYWKWKSAKSFFGDALMTIELDTTQQLLDAPRDRTAISNPARMRRSPQARRSAASESPTLLLRRHRRVRRRAGVSRLHVLWSGTAAAHRVRSPAGRRPS